MRLTCLYKRIFFLKKTLKGYLWSVNILTQLSNPKKMPNLTKVCLALKKGSKTHYKLWSNRFTLLGNKAFPGFFILMHSKGNLIWNSHIACGVSLESSLQVIQTLKCKKASKSISWLMSKVVHVQRPLLGQLYLHSHYVTVTFIRTVLFKGKFTFWLT